MNLDCRQAHTDGNGLAFLAADSNALIELEIITDGRDLTKNGRTIADQRCPFHGCCDVAVSIRYASLAVNTNLPLVMSTWPPPK